MSQGKLQTIDVDARPQGHLGLQSSCVATTLLNTLHRLLLGFRAAVCGLRASLAYLGSSFHMDLLCSVGATTFWQHRIDIRSAKVEANYCTRWLKEFKTQHFEPNSRGW